MSIMTQPIDVIVEEIPRSTPTVTITHSLGGYPNFENSSIKVRICTDNFGNMDLRKITAILYRFNLYFVGTHFRLISYSSQTKLRTVKRMFVAPDYMLVPFTGNYANAIETISMPPASNHNQSSVDASMFCVTPQELLTTSPVRETNGSSADTNTNWRSRDNSPDVIDVEAYTRRLITYIDNHSVNVPAGVYEEVSSTKNIRRARNYITNVLGTDSLNNNYIDDILSALRTHYRKSE